MKVAGTKFYLFSHNDLDGVGCGIVAKCAFGDLVEIRYHSVDALNVQVERFLNRVKEKGLKDAFLLITDLSVNPEMEQALNRYVETGGQVKLIDHHKTAVHLNACPWGWVQISHENGKLASATSLFYEYLIQNRMMTPTRTIDEFVELVREWDTWEWEPNENIRAKRLNDLFFMVSIDEFETKMVDRLQKNEPFAFDEFEEKILDMEEEKIERYIRRKKREMVQTFIGEHCAGIVHAESYHSELASELGKENPHLDYIVMLNMGGKKTSFRTIHDNVDVSEIAGRYGGGGHAKAAGCTLTDEVYSLFVAGAFSLEPIKPDAMRNRYNLKESRSGTYYENRKDDTFLLFPSPSGDEWRIERNGTLLEQSFRSFAQAERFIKRQYGAWLAKDENFVQFLMEQMMRSRQENQVPLEW